MRGSQKSASLDGVLDGFIDKAIDPETSVKGIACGVIDGRALVATLRGFKLAKR